MNFAVPIAVGVAALVMCAVEQLGVGRRWPRVRGWWPRAIAMNLVQVGLVVLAGVWWTPWFQELRPWSADALGPVGGGVLGYLVITFVYYWWHRARHEVPALWRLLHQLHHSPQRLEIVTSFYKHPLEILANSVLSSVILYLGVGLGPEAAAGTVLIAGLAELVYHWNVPTPYWLGFVVQRPESHCVHHQDGLHRYNFADLPLWDMLFGTFRNPRYWDARCGFGEDEHRLTEMLRFEDVQTRKEAA